MIYGHDLYYSHVFHFLSIGQILIKFYFGDPYLKFDYKYEFIMLTAN